MTRSQQNFQTSGCPIPPFTDGVAANDTENRAA